MNKSELINAMAEEAGLSKADAKKALDAFVSTVSKTLSGGDKIVLIGFGTFSIKFSHFRVTLILLFFIKDKYLCILKN